MKTAGSFEITVPVYHTARCQIPEDCNLKRMVCPNRLVQNSIMEMLLVISLENTVHVGLESFLVNVGVEFDLLLEVGLGELFEYPRTKM